jgi:hypothetical protein
MIEDDFLNLIEFLAGKASASLQTDRIEPELRLARLAIVAFDVDVSRLVPVARVEEEAIRTLAKDGRHNRNNNRP